MAAPASAAPIAASAISCAVIGRCGDIDGVWIEPVTAQVMMTLFLTGHGFTPSVFGPILSNHRAIAKALSHAGEPSGRGAGADATVGVRVPTTKSWPRHRCGAFPLPLTGKVTP